MVHRVITMTLLVAAGVSSSARAHDLWVEPARFASEKPGPVQVRVRVGHEEDVKLVEIDRKRLLRFEAWEPRGGASTALELGEEPSGPSVAKLTTPGTWTLVYHALPTYIELEAAAFEDYLRHEGLGRIIEERSKRGERESKGRESYGRSCKALVQVATSTRGFDQRVGLPIEISAVSNPFAGREPVRFRVEFRGEPLPDVRVDLLRLDDLREARHARTSREGVVSFPAPRSGRWIVATTHMVRADESVEGDWESFWATLSFARP